MPQLQASGSLNVSCSYIQRQPCYIKGMGQGGPPQQQMMGILPQQMMRVPPQQMGIMSIPANNANMPQVNHHMGHPGGNKEDTEDVVEIPFIETTVSPHLEKKFH